MSKVAKIKHDAHMREGGKEHGRRAHALPFSHSSRIYGKEENFDHLPGASIASQMYVLHFVVMTCSGSSWDLNTLRLLIRVHTESKGITTW